jgi:hypothetical protein
LFAPTPDRRDGHALTPNAAGIDQLLQRASTVSETLTGMAFKVNRNGPEPAVEFEDKDKFEIVSPAAC